MLPPISDHESHAEQQERKQDGEEGGSMVHLIQRVHAGVRGKLPKGSFGRNAGSALSEEVQGQIEPDENVEATDVMEEMPNVVPLIAQRRRKVVGPVPLYVMVLDMVVEVRVPRVSHERIQDVREELVEEGKSRVEDASHVDVLMHHERVRTDVRRLHDAVQDGVDPGEVIEEERGAGHRRGEVEQEVSEHDDVCLNADDGPSSADVRVQHPSPESLRQLDLLQVEVSDNGWDKVRALGVIEGLEGCDCVI